MSFVLFLQAFGVQLTRLLQQQACVILRRAASSVLLVTVSVAVLRLQHASIMLPASATLLFFDSLCVLVIAFWMQHFWLPEVRLQLVPV